jgi:hydroxymethylpyrimidine pyrophosphatase-like HAD family hydrolase
LHLSFLAIATDYDETLACGSRADVNALNALQRWRTTGGRLVLVTGRLLEDLRRVFSNCEMFDYVVAENGAVLYRPATEEEKLLGGPPPVNFLARLRQKHVEPLFAGRCIVATEDPHESAVREAIVELQLDWHVVRNRESLMAMPKGVDKGSGLRVALGELGLEAKDVFGIGDAENDVALFKHCGSSAAVANAGPEIKRHATFVTRGACGAGVAEVVHLLLSQESWPAGPSPLLVR